MSLVIVGSLAFDTIETPTERKERIIGGSCSFSALAASYFTSPQIVAVIGEDFPQEFISLLNRRGVDTRGVTREAGKTFHWEGRYGDDPNQRTTIRTELNVFQDFKPRLLQDYAAADIVFLGNIDPELQEDIRRQAQKPRLVAMDTINLWINTKPEALVRVLKEVDIFFANDEEVRMITDELNLIKAGKKLLSMGPSLAVIKKGEHGALLVGEEFMFGVMAYPCETVIDPTGAGDSFGQTTDVHVAAGALMVMDDVEAFFSINREQLGFIPEEKGGDVAGKLVVIDKDRETGKQLKIDCTKFGSGAYSIPISVEELGFETKAKFILAIETAGMFQRLVKHNFWKKANCILISMGGVPTRACRRFIRRLSDEKKIPVYVFVDCDPYGIGNIYRTLKVGSGNAAHINEFF